MVSNIDPTFPISGIDQPSQGFRDNFNNTKIEIEVLQGDVGTLQTDVTSLQGTVVTVIDDISDITITAPAANDFLRFNFGTGQWENVSLDIFLDTTPQLGGNLDVNGFNITMPGTETVDGRDLSVDGTKLDGIESGATADQTGAEIKIAYEGEADTNAFTDAEKTKLTGIETSATADQTAGEILTAIKTVDGTGSGLDADLLDGNEAIAFATAAQGSLADSALQNVVEDTNPQLGGELDAQNKKIVSLATPTANSDAANKAYVDSVAAGLDPKESVRLATVGGDLSTFTFVNNGGVGDTLTALGAGFTSVDSFNLADGDRVLVKDRATATQNGIYVASDTGSGGTTVLTRATDQDGTPSNEVSAGNFTFVEIGSINNATGWVVIGDGIITINVGDIDWVKFSAVTGALVDIVDDTNPRLGGNLDVNGFNITMPGTETVDGRDLSVDGAKLDLIEADAKDDQTATDIRILGFFDITNDGTGSGLDADLLDGNEATAFATAAQGSLADSALQNVVEDTTPRLGAQLDVNTFGLGDGTNLLLDFVEDASAVNHIEIENEATGSGPIIRAVGADSNINLVLDTKGTGNIVLDGLKWPTADGTLNQFIRTDGFGNLTFFSAITILVDDLTPQLGAQLDVNTFGLGDGTNLLLDFVEDASAVNHIEIENEATGSGPIIRSAGSDTNIDLKIEAKGTGTIQIGSSDLVGITPTITATGADTNIDLKLSPKGTGVIRVTSDLVVTGTIDGTIDLTTGTNTEDIQDFVGAMFTGNTDTRVTSTYNDSTGKVDLVVDDLVSTIPIYKDHSFISPNSSGAFYQAGFYEAPTADANISNAGTTQTLGSSNNPYAAHAFVVHADAGTASGGTGVVEVEVSGTSITDGGVRAAADTEIVIADVTAMTTDTYAETTKKWIGQVTYTIQNAGGGTHTTFTADFNYGFAKYDDYGNRDFTVTDVEVTGLAGANDSGFNVELLYHTATGWIYNATTFVPGTTALASMDTDHSTENNLANGELFAWKRTGLSQTVLGSGSEGILIRTTTSVNSSVQIMNAHIGVNF